MTNFGKFILSDEDKNHKNSKKYKEWSNKKIAVEGRKSYTEVTK